MHTKRYAYYNEIEPVAAHVLECLVKDKIIADGIVDRRSIVDVDPKDVAEFRQAHFFAGGGLWSVAARMAGWPDDRESTLPSNKLTKQRPFRAAVWGFASSGFCGLPRNSDKTCTLGVCLRLRKAERGTRHSTIKRERRVLCRLRENIRSGTRRGDAGFSGKRSGDSHGDRNLQRECPSTWPAVFSVRRRHARSPSGPLLLLRLSSIVGQDQQEPPGVDNLQRYRPAKQCRRVHFGKRRFLLRGMQFCKARNVCGAVFTTYSENFSPYAGGTVRVYYNEIDQHACDWLQNLMDRGAISPGKIDNRDIRDVHPADLSGFDRVHFFAGIGVWDYALNRAGFAGRCWTGSCPCQSFSAAGKRAGFADERHLWPAFFHLIEICRPPVVFGEQVASKDGLAWLDLVHADLEGADYACGAFDLCAAGVGAPQIRQRLFFVANSDRERRRAIDALLREEIGERRTGDIFETTGGSALGELAGAEGERLQRWSDDGDEGRRQRASGQGCEAGELGDAECAGLEGHGGHGDDRDQSRRVGALAAGSTPLAGASRGMDDGERPGPINGYWRDADWLFCTDGKWRPTQPLPQQMVDGPAAGLGCVRANQDTGFPLIEREAFGAGGAFESKSRAKMLKGYGNCIVAPLAVEFINAAMECSRD